MRKKSDPPIEIRQLAPDDAKRGIARLRRRLDDLAALDPARLTANDQDIKNVRDAIVTNIAEIYGPNSPQYREHEHLHVWDGPLAFNMTPDEIREGQTRGIAKTKKLVQGLIKALEEQLAELEVDPSIRIRAAFQELDLHPRIAAAAAQLFRDKHYRNAVLDATVALVAYVKEKAGRPDLDGVNLMRQVFRRDNPILRVNDLADSSQQDEQEGMMNLFAGAVFAFRNPRAHDLVPDAPEYALEAVAFLSMLAKRVDTARS